LVFAFNQKGFAMSIKTLSACAATAILTTAVCAAVMLDKPAIAQAFGVSPVAVSAAAANNGNSQAWMVDSRTNVIVFCQVVSGKPACQTTTLQGTFNPR
jgi:hypothetical protein